MIATRKAQSILEFTVLMVIIIGVFIAMQSYVKRGIQGRWKTSIDDFGEQYDPHNTNSIMNYSMISNSSTRLKTIQDTNGYWTQRLDNSASVSKTGGTISVGSEF